MKTSYRKRYLGTYAAIGLALAVALMLLLTSCAPQERPIYITTPPPPIPPECAVICPAEPKLPYRDITDIEAVKDRSAMKEALRCEKHNRTTCAARLKVLLRH